MRVSLRSKKTEERYQKHKAALPVGHCPFCEQLEIKKRYKYWIIAPNDFPYDDVYTTHDLLVCKRHVADETELTIAEQEELTNIKRDILNNNNYNQILENSRPRRTVPPHYHQHLVTF